MNGFISGIIPLKPGTKWVYRIQCKLFSRDVLIEVMDKRNNYYLVKSVLNKNLEVSIVLKCDVDLSVVGYRKSGTITLNDPSEFTEISKVELLKSPVVAGTTWTNSFGAFDIVDCEYTFKSGEREFPNCIHLHLKDSSGDHNNIYIKEGAGILFASLYVDGLGPVSISLKKFN